MLMTILIYKHLTFTAYKAESLSQGLFMSDVTTYGAVIEMLKFI